MQGATDYVGEARVLAAQAATSTSKCTAVYIAATLQGAETVADELERLSMEVEEPEQDHACHGWRLQGRWPLHHACSPPQAQAEGAAKLDEAGVAAYAKRMEALHQLALAKDLLAVLDYALHQAGKNGHSRMLALVASARAKVLACRS